MSIQVNENTRAWTLKTDGIHKSIKEAILNRINDFANETGCLPELKKWVLWSMGDMFMMFSRNENFEETYVAFWDVGDNELSFFEIQEENMTEPYDLLKIKYKYKEDREQ